jgi:hypothetical protein
MVLTSGGNLGVGVTSPNGKIACQVTASGTFQNAIVASDGTSSDFLVKIKTNETQIMNSGSSVLSFGTSNTERARITSGGDFYFGVAATNSGVVYIQTGTGTGGRIIDAINSAGNRYFEVQTDGDVYNTNGTYGTISDERLKQDIIDAPSQWNDLKAVRFRKYRMKTDVEANADAPALLGVVAQELEQTSPGLVDEHPNEDGTTTKTVKSSILLMKAAVALQEAMTRIEKLEAEVLALKGA